MIDSVFRFLCDYYPKLVGPWMELMGKLYGIGFIGEACV